jgi:hypothetical protein
MRTISAIVISTLVLLSGCGIESASTVTTVGKLKADEAKQGKEQMETFKANLNAATKASEESVKRSEEAYKN